MSAPAVVAVAFDRPGALARLLGSLARAVYPEGIEIPLVISIDHGGDPEVRAVAERFQWAHGPKEVRYQAARLGLKDHILRCGDLTAVFGAIILLEEDLYVSRHFYGYAVQALGYYEADARIAGIALYTHRTNVFCREAFVPLVDGSDVFFLQQASSRGQAWSRAQWARFREWYGGGVDVTDEDPLPDRLIRWPDTSWLKRFIKYMVETERQFVYPRISLTTNFGDAGTNTAQASDTIQVPLLLEARDFRLCPLDASRCLYDPWFEIAPAALDRLTDAFHGRAYEVDLYGTKRLSKVRTPFLLTGRRCRGAEHRFANRLRPHELNVIDGLEGDAFAFGPTARVEDRLATRVRPGSYEDFRRRFSAKDGLRFGLRKAADRLRSRR